METKITIIATKEKVTTQLEIGGKTYTQELIPTPTGARYEGVMFEEHDDKLPQEIIDALCEFGQYSILKSLQD